MAEKLTIGSLFDGIGGFEYVASLYGIEPIWASEIEDAPIRITKRHFPNMKHYGDITKMNGAEIEPVDILSGGSPCTDLSVAGKQEGISRKCTACGMVLPLNFSENLCPKCGAEIEFTRSGLFMEQIRIIKEMREATNERFPKVIIWENVPGVLGSNNGDDFQCVLSEFAGLFGEKLPTLRPEKWCKAGEIVGDNGSLAWRTLDAQYWGVPQRRKRIYLVVDLTGQRAGEILFKSESLRRHTPQGEIPWKRTSGAVESGVGTADRTGKAESGEVESCVVLNDQGGSVMDVTENKTGTLRAETHGHAPVVVDDVDKTVYGICSLGSNCMKSDNPDSGFYEADIVKTLDTSGANPSCNQGGNVVVETPVYCMQGNCIDRGIKSGCNGKGWGEDVCFTLTTADRHAVDYSVSENGSQEVRITKEVAATLTTGGGKPGQGYPCVLEEKKSQCGAFLGKQSDSARGIGYSEKVSPTLVAGEPPQVAEYNKHSMAFPYQMGPGVPHLPCSDELSPTLVSSQRIGVLIDNHSQDCRYKECKDGICPTLSAKLGTGGNNQPLYVEPTIPADEKIYVVTDRSHTEVCINQSPTLVARDYKSPNIVNTPQHNSIVRRLTPLECTRLQGFPDGWVDGVSDAAQYKALGNSVALPCVDYVMSGVVDVLDPIVEDDL